MCGGASAGSARYIFTTHNRALTKLLYPEQDYDLLNFTEDDGHFYEPDYFAPILPMSVLESDKIPSHGWKLESYGRDVFSIIKIVRMMIYYENYTPVSDPPMNIRGWTGKYVNNFGYETTTGKYTVNGNRITITELPYRVWTEKYEKKLNERVASWKLTEAIMTIETAVIEIDESFEIGIRVSNAFWSFVTTTNETNIPVDYVPKNVPKKTTKKAKKAEEDETNINTDIPKYKIPLDVFLKIKKIHTKNINFVGIERQVLEFDNYYEPIKYWFTERKRIYEERVDRELILMNLRLNMFKDTMIYLLKCRDLAGKTLEQMVTELLDLDMKAYNKELLTSPGRTKTADLVRLCMDDVEKTTDGYKITFDYVLNMRDKDKTKINIEKFRKNIIVLEKKIKEYNLLSSIGRFTGAGIWLSELDSLEELLKREIPRNWGAVIEIDEADDKTTKKKKVTSK
jgi:hypothetical protein